MDDVLGTPEPPNANFLESPAVPSLGRLRRPRVLIVAEGASMAHFTRPLTLAESLDPREYDVHFYTSSTFGQDLSGKSFTVGRLLRSRSADEFLDRQARGASLFSEVALRDYIEEDRLIIHRVRPDLIVGDCRISLPISARLENVRLAQVVNAHWSPHARVRHIIPELPITRLIPPALLAPFASLAVPLVMKQHVRQMNRVRRQAGVLPVPLDPRGLFTLGDYVLYPDLEEMVPTTGRPANHHYIGPCDWAPRLPRPEWWPQMLEDPRRKVLIALGSTGPLRVLPALLQALEEMNIAVLLATSGRPAIARPSSGYVADLVPLQETAAQCVGVVTQGGAGGMYAVLGAGTPILAIPSNVDQHQCSAALVESGAGLSLRVENARGSRLRAALHALVYDVKISEAAKRWKILYRQCDTKARFRRFVAEALRGTAEASTH